MGFDISSAQFPPLKAFPTNTGFKELDVYGPIPDEYCGKFDLVQIRLIIAGVRESGPVPILENLLKLLKPGGYLIWIDACMDHIFRAQVPINVDTDPTTVVVTGQVPGLSSITRWRDYWVPEMDKFLIENGVEDVNRLDPHYPMTANWVRAWGYMLRLVLEMHGRYLAEGAKAGDKDKEARMKALEEVFKKFDEEAKEGWYTWFNPVICTGRKPGGAPT